MHDFFERFERLRKKINFVWLGSAACAVLNGVINFLLVVKRYAVCHDCSLSVEMYALHA